MTCTKTQTNESRVAKLERLKETASPEARAEIERYGDLSTLHTNTVRLLINATENMEVR